KMIVDRLRLRGAAARGWALGVLFWSVFGLLRLVGLRFDFCFRLVVRFLGEVEFGRSVLRPPVVGGGDQQAGGQDQANGSAALPAARGQVEHGSKLPGAGVGEEGLRVRGWT